MILDSFRYLYAPWRRSTKPFTKRLSRCEGKSTCISCFFALCSPSAQSLTIAHFAWCWARSDTFTLCEDAPQNCLQNGSAVVEVSPLVFRVFLLMQVSFASPTLTHVMCYLPYMVVLWLRAMYHCPKSARECAVARSQAPNPVLI